MRSFIATYWFIGPIIALAALIFCAEARSIQRQNAMEIIDRQFVDSVYQLASQKDYKAISRSKRLASESVEFLKLQDHLFGRVKSWVISPSYDVATVSVCRANQYTTEVVSRSNYGEYGGFGVEREPNDLLYLDQEGNYESEYGLDESISNTFEAEDVARKFIHNYGVKEGAKITGLKGEQFGNYWIVRQTTKRYGLYERHYIVISPQNGWLRRYPDARRWSDAETTVLSKDSGPSIRIR